MGSSDNGTGCLCNVQLDWVDDFSTLIDNDGRPVASGRAGEVFADPSVIKDVCLGCLRASLYRAVTGLSKHDDRQSETFSIVVPCQYPKGVQLPFNSDVGEILEELLLFMDFDSGELSVTLEVSNVKSSEVESLKRELEPILGLYRADLLDISVSGLYKRGTLRLLFQGSPLVGEVMRSSLQIDTMLRGVAWDLSDPMEAYHCVMSGDIEFLLGTAESASVDAKRAHYRLSTNDLKFEFAVDVASFANSDRGGLILIGLATENKTRGVDVFDHVVGCEPSRAQIDKYYETVKNWIVPAIMGFRVESCEIDGRHIALILVPPQQNARKPFLVKGGIIEGKGVSAAAFSVPLRIGDRNRYLATEEIQAMLASVYSPG
jgi:hypothetical protein